MSSPISSTKLHRREVVKTIKKVMQQNQDREEGFESPYSDLSRYRYTRSWDDGLFSKIYGYDVNIPDMPPEEDIINFGLPIEEQIFRKTLVPEDLQFCSEEERESFIESEHHRRKHGLWFYIKGEPIYIPGVFYYFLNYWSVQTGKPVKFHMGDWKFFMIWMHVVRSENIYGLLVFKCRRIGDTEKGLCIIYEYATRVRNTINQLYDCRTEKDMIKTFKRLKLAHKKMIWYMKPITKNHDPATSFEFTEKDRRVDISKSFVDADGKVNISEYEYPSLESEITYYTNDGGADGSRIGREYVDEFGKFNQIDPETLWDLSKKALEDDREGYIIGKSLFTSTIEEMQNGKTLARAKKMWKDSDPTELDDSGATVSGMIRVVRGTLDRAVTDRWGYVNEEKEIERIRTYQAFLIKNKQWKKLIKHKRQNCITIKDVFSNISEGSPFDLEKINSRDSELTFSDTQLYVRGNLDWVDNNKPIAGDPHKTNKNCKAFFTPNENGRWDFAYFPKDFALQENKQKPMARIPMPGNTQHFACGIDPVAYKENIEDEEKSLSAVAVKRILDYRIDKKENNDLFNDNGDPVDGGRFFKTNRYCCTYLYRHKNPADNYNDWLLTIVFFGTDFLIEKNHGAAFEVYLSERGYLEYYMDKSGLSNSKGKQETFGLTATEKSINSYFSLIGELVSNWCNTIDLVSITTQLKTMEYDTRGKHDLGVAVGFTEVAASQKLVENEKFLQHEKEEEEGVYMGDFNYYD